jgi:RNA polymerase sigma factor (sigma-70 family)
VTTDSEVIKTSMTEPSAFGTIFDRHATVLFRYLVRRVGPDEADQILGELFRIAFERRATFDCAREDARPWLYGIATNLLANHHRREARRMHATARLLADRAAPSDATEDAAAKIDAEAMWPQVVDAVAALPEGERSVLLLYVWEGLSYEEIATSLAIPVGTVRSRLNRTRGRIQKLRREDAEND